MQEQHWLDLRSRVKSAIDELIQLGLCKPQLKNPQTMEWAVDWILNPDDMESNWQHWEVYRLDDDGNETKLTGGLPRHLAERWMADFVQNASAHSYWIQPEAPTTERYPSAELS